MKFHLFFYSAIVLLLGACTEVLITPVYTQYTLPEDIKIESILFTSDSVGYATGGTLLEVGLIYKTIDAGENWELIYSCSKKINSLSFIDNQNAMACGDSLLFIRTSDAGKTWSAQYDFTFLDQYERSNFTSVQMLTKNTALMVGDKALVQGRIYMFSDLDFDTSKFELKNYPINNGLTNISVGQTSRYSYIFGYGTIVKFDNLYKTFEYLEISGDFYIAGCHTNDSTLFACGYDGGIYKSTNSGDSWSEMLEQNGVIGDRIHFIDIAQFSNEIIFSCGEDGILYRTMNAGKSWDKLDLSTQSALSAIYCTERFTYVGSDKGILYRIQNTF